VATLTSAGNRRQQSASTGPRCTKVTEATHLLPRADVAPIALTLLAHDSTLIPYGGVCRCLFHQAAEPDLPARSEITQ
jgi:hypothetical protein